MKGLLGTDKSTKVNQTEKKRLAHVFGRNETERQTALNAAVEIWRSLGEHTGSCSV